MYWALSAAFALGLLACSGDAPSCLDEAEFTCAPLYEPEYQQVFERTLKPRCALEGGACHSREGNKGGLQMEDPDETYQLLIGEGRVLEGDAACSLLVLRLEGAGVGVMPPGAQLSEAERCAVKLWVEQGAQR